MRNQIRNPALRHYAKRNPSAFGGSLRSTRRGRSRGRPLTSANSIHLTLRSSKARGPLSFRQPRHAARIQALTKKFAGKYEIRIFSVANVGNHLHLHLRLPHKNAYKPFIRALTAAIAMAVTGASRWKKTEGKFWDRRPFSRFVQGASEFLRLQDYVTINQLEGDGIARNTARWIVGWRSRGVPLVPG